MGKKFEIKQIFTGKWRATAQVIFHMGWGERVKRFIRVFDTKGEANLAIASFFRAFQ